MQGAHDCKPLVSSLFLQLASIQHNHLTVAVACACTRTHYPRFNLLNFALYPGEPFLSGCSSRARAGLSVNLERTAHEQDLLAQP